jgi:two-component system LytT family sensor kinase
MVFKFVRKLLTNWKQPGGLPLLFICTFSQITDILGGLHIPLLNSLMKRLRIPTIIIHLVGWLIFLSLPVLFLASGPSNLSNNRPFIFLDILLFFGCYFFLFYFNTYFLIPKLYLGKQYFLYFLIVLLMLVVIGFLKPFSRLLANPHPDQLAFAMEHHSPVEKHFPLPAPENSFDPGLRPGPPSEGGPLSTFDIVSIFLFLMFLAFSIATEVLRQLRSAEQRAMRAEADKTHAELSFLKAQINPHFLFNTLNNLYTLAVKKSEDTAESILKLSNIMRYVTNEVITDFVSLESEVECIKDYIDLQRLRVSKNTSIDFSISGPLEPHMIAPLILMTFVENAFKYGISNHEESSITIRILAEARSITFNCENGLFPLRIVSIGHGIGIANTRQRLNHLYPGKFLLATEEKNEKFIVLLILKS